MSRSCKCAILLFLSFCVLFAGLFAYMWSAVSKSEIAQPKTEPTALETVKNAVTPKKAEAIEVYELVTTANLIPSAFEKWSPYFRIHGDHWGKTRTGLIVMFSWKDQHGTVRTNSVPLERVFRKFDENVSAPKVQFYPIGNMPSIYGSEYEGYPDKVDHVTVILKKSDWPFFADSPKTQNNG